MYLKACLLFIQKRLTNASLILCSPTSIRAASKGIPMGLIKNAIPSTMIPLIGEPVSITRTAKTARAALANPNRKDETYRRPMQSHATREIGAVRYAMKCECMQRRLI